MVSGLEITDSIGNKHWKPIKAYKAQCPANHVAWLVKSAQREDEMTIHCNHCGLACNVTSYGAN